MPRGVGTIVGLGDPHVYPHGAEVGSTLTAAVGHRFLISWCTGIFSKKLARAGSRTKNKNKNQYFFFLEIGLGSRGFDVVRQEKKPQQSEQLCSCIRTSKLLL